MELIDKLASNDTSNIGMLTSDSKDISVKFEDKCIKVTNNNERLNGPKISRKMQKRKSIFKYQ